MWINVWIFDHVFCIDGFISVVEADVYMEVDFILYGEKGIHAFEIKRTGKVSISMLSGLKAFVRDYPMAKAYFVYGGERRLRENNIEIMPITEVLYNLPAILK